MTVRLATAKLIGETDLLDDKHTKYAYNHGGYMVANRNNADLLKAPSLFDVVAELNKRSIYVTNIIGSSVAATFKPQIVHYKDSVVTKVVINTRFNDYNESLEAGILEALKLLD